MTNTRGIVVGVNSSGSTETAIAIDGRIDGEDLRRYVLYWDQIDYPYIDGLGGANIDGQPELALLRDSGCLITSAINLPEPPGGWNAFGGIPIVPGIPFKQQINEVRGFLQIEAAEMHNASGGQLWSIAQSGVDLQLPGVALTLLVQPTEFIQSIEVALHDSLPVPDASSNLEAVLAFKENRRSELLRFRNAMDNLYDAIEKSESKARAITRAREEIERSLLDLHKTLDETRFQKVVSTVKVYLNLKDNSVLNLLFPAIGGTGAALVEVPPIYGGLAGLGLNAILALGTKRTPKIDKLGDQLRDYAYLYHVERKLVR